MGALARLVRRTLGHGEPAAAPPEPELVLDGPSLEAGPAGFSLRHDLPPLRARFVKLYRAFQRGQWHPDDGTVDWSREPVVEDLFVFGEQALELRALFVADFFYGEEFTLRGAGRRLDALEEMDEKLCYTLMIGDEHRHAEVFGRYQRKLGRIRPPDPRLVETLLWAETLDTEAFLLGALILETIAVHAMPPMWRGTRDPLLRAFLPRIHADETRHEAFAHLYLTARAPRWTAARRAELSRLAGEMYGRQLRYMRERNPLIPFRIPAAIGLALDAVVDRSLRAGTRSLASRFAALGLTPSEEMARWT